MGANFSPILSSLKKKKKKKKEKKELRGITRCATVSKGQSKSLLGGLSDGRVTRVLLDLVVRRLAGQEELELGRDPRRRSNTCIGERALLGIRHVLVHAIPSPYGLFCSSPAWATTPAHSPRPTSNFTESLELEQTLTNSEISRLGNRRC